MSNGELLQIEPLELQFPLELKKQIPCPMVLTNISDQHVAFKVKTTNPKKYCVRPNAGVLVPHSTCNVVVTMQAQKETPTDMQCRDKFLVQSVIVGSGSTAKDITSEVFSKESGNRVDERKLGVTYVQPQPPSPVREGSEESSSPRVSFSDNGVVDQMVEFSTIKGFVEPQENTPEAKTLTSSLIEETCFITQQNNKLKQELELLRQKRDRTRGGILLICVTIVGLVGILLGYLLRRA